MNHVAEKFTPYDYKDNGCGKLLVQINLFLIKLSEIGLTFERFINMQSYDEYMLWCAAGLDDDYLFCNDMRYFWNMRIWLSVNMFNTDDIEYRDGDRRFLKLKDGE